MKTIFFQHLRLRALSRALAAWVITVTACVSMDARAQLQFAEDFQVLWPDLLSFSGASFGSNGNTGFRLRAVGPQTDPPGFHGASSGGGLRIRGGFATIGARRVVGGHTVTLPTISAIDDQTILENGSIGPLPFTVGDVETPASALILTATSSNPVLVPLSNILFGGNGSNRTVTITPPPSQSGSSLITVTVRDGEGATASEPFLVTVTPRLEPDIQVIPTSLAFGSQMLGTTSLPQTVTVQNAGTSDLHVNSISSENAGLFPVSVRLTLPAAVPPGSNLTFQVCFAPTTPGAFSNAITILSDDPLEPTRTVACSGTGVDMLDFGDAPDPGYHTRLANDGARHRLGPLFLGTRVDAEADGQPGFSADRDDHNGGADDEDGVIFMEPLSPGAVVTVTVVASAAGILNAWVDFNQNGAWEPAEQIFNCRTVAAGPNFLEFTVPAGIPTGYTYARFRLSSVCALGPAGLAPDGEVEDYGVYIRAARLVPNLIARLNNGLPRLEWDAPDTFLEQALSPTGPFGVVPGATSPFAPPAGQPTSFYRLRGIPSAGDWDLASMAFNADLVFDGTVANVQYRNSDSNALYTASLPHTFVTFQIHEVLKGRVLGQTISLRFVGGPAPDGRILLRGDSTLFDVGERSVLFVKNNGRGGLPLVGQGRGRFRIVNDQVFSEQGRPVIWTTEARLSFGPHQGLAEVEQNLIGTEVFHRKLVRRESEAAPPIGPDGTHLGATAFRSLLKIFVQRAHTAQQLADLPPAASCDISQPFFVRMPIPKPPPSDEPTGP